MQKKYLAEEVFVEIKNCFKIQKQKLMTRLITALNPKWKNNQQLL